MRACVFTYMCGGAHEIDLVLSHFILDFFFSRYIRKDKIQNEDIQFKIRVAFIEENMRELIEIIWVQMIIITEPLRKTDLIQVEGTKEVKRDLEYC